MMSEIIFPEMTSAESAPASGVGGDDDYDFDATGWLPDGETLISHTISSSDESILAVSSPTVGNNSAGVAALAVFALQVVTINVVNQHGIQVTSKCVSSGGKTHTFKGRVPIVVESTERG